ncbi:hypothetical protein L2520_03795 [Limosilactobacillus vaginalis]|uniref:Uncharacterized protein n=1 Tax=Limosilactobacillus vaginalis TaxID=1633 RepID=A0ABT4K6N2_9LACO|nr:hypothetical protein [Limosilactobacillus vaginalis]MCZ3746546.1 hypothetical protein [Limosilactobacillus vaginalis]MCZ3751562.1 hypothetical protein [Limosilactobacillus vaginalis]MCZ3753248.1 hypothetical protein [Limosilactobacillus vaginalis]MCZ3755066.1 hypothetical protein [Limosilactobacillus vaginalis]MCZ3756734.1 hypothetical protein [Limosilactobacillus vaginalis]
MTKTELVNSMIKLGFDFEETEDFLKFENADGNSVSIEKDVDNTDVRGKMLSLVGAYLQTPIAERNPEPKFHVRFPGLNSSNGKQYLSTERRPLNGKFFMAAYNPNLIQKFTWKEIQTISNQPGFKGTFMQNAILTNMKKVNSDE